MRLLRRVERQERIADKALTLTTDTVEGRKITVVTFSGQGFDQSEVRKINWNFFRITGNTLTIANFLINRIRHKNISSDLSFADYHKFCFLIKVWHDTGELFVENVRELNEEKKREE